MYGGHTKQDNKMAWWQELSDVNTTSGMHKVWVYASTTVDIFTPMVLFVFFMIVLLASYFSQKRSEGRGDFITSFAAAGFSTFLVALAMTLVAGIINLSTLVVCFVVAIISALALLISKSS